MSFIVLISLHPEEHSDYSRDRTFRVQNGAPQLAGSGYRKSGTPAYGDPSMGSVERSIPNARSSSSVMSAHHRGGPHFRAQRTAQL